MKWTFLDQSGPDQMIGLGCSRCPLLDGFFSASKLIGQPTTLGQLAMVVARERERSSETDSS